MKRFNRDRFAEIWNGAGSVREVMRLTGLSYGIVTRRASIMRTDEDYHLKKFYRDHEFFVAIGKIGGSRGAKDGTIKGFAANNTLAREAGSKGGKISKRGPAKTTTYFEHKPSLMKRIMRRLHHG